MSNAIPLASPSLKRARQDADDDDDVSLVSRSPSPPSHDAMDLDQSGLHKYDEYVRGAVREIITVETKIKPTNKGFALLSKLGWVEGRPIGLSGEGRVDPIPFHIKSDSTGLGKSSQDFRVIEETVSQRRELDSERQQRENEEQRRLREDAVARRSALESEISSTLRAFYCTLCDKQFKNVAQYDEHTNSYAHHHKARFRDMQANVRLTPKEEIDKRKEKERRREEKELRKIAAANGIKMPKPVTISNPSTALAPVLSDSSVAGVSSNMEVEPKPVEPQKSGWASMSSSLGSSSSSGFTKSGWAAIGPSNTSSSRFAQPPPPSAPPTFSTSSPSQTVNSTQNTDHLPTFRNAGWTSLDTGSTQPPPPAEEPPPPPPSATASARGGWSSSNLGSAQLAPPPPSDPRTMQTTPPPPCLPPSQPAVSPPENQPVRSNWQQFKQGIGRRR